MLRDSVVVVVVAVVRTRSRAIPLAIITTKKSTHGFPFVSHIWDAYRAPLGGPSGRRSSAKNNLRGITLDRGPMCGIHSLTLIISCSVPIGAQKRYQIMFFK